MTAVSGAVSHTRVGVMRQHSCSQKPAVSTCLSWTCVRLSSEGHPDNPWDQHCCTQAFQSASDSAHSTQICSWCTFVFTHSTSNSPGCTQGCTGLVAFFLVAAHFLRASNASSHSSQNFNQNPPAPRWQPRLVYRHSRRRRPHLLHGTCCWGAARPSCGTPSDPYHGCP